MTYDIIENLIEQINSCNTKICKCLRLFWSKGTIVDKYESVEWNQNYVSDHNAQIERKIGSIRTEIGNLRDDLNDSFKELIAKALNCPEDTVRRLYAYIVEIAEDAKHDGDDELKLRLEYTKKLLEILAGGHES